MHFENEGMNKCKIPDDIDWGARIFEIEVAGL